MNNKDYSEKANFRALVEADGKDRIQDRLNIIAVFFGTDEHITTEEMYRLLREKGYDYNPEFVRSYMSRIVGLGFAHKKQFEGQPVRYEHRHLGRHHDHLICTKCGRIVEFSNLDIERLQVKIAAEQGFHMLQHKMEIYGLCAECLVKRRPLMPLSKAKPGERIVIREIFGQKTARAHMADMGLRLDDHIEIISNNGQGRLILARDCTRLAIGRGIAQKIMVSLSDDDKDGACEEET